MFRLSVLITMFITNVMIGQSNYEKGMEKASFLAPENPKIAFNKADWAIGSANYFGQDTKPLCQGIEKSLELFANFKPESKFHPNRGLEKAYQVAKTCNQ